MRFETSLNLVVLSDAPDDVIHGVADFVAYAGNGVVNDPADPEKLKLATGTRGRLLVRDVVESISIESRIFPDGFRQPVLKGLEATARRAITAEMEGADLIQLSGTGAIDGNTAAHTELGWNAGRLRVKQGGEETAGWLRAQLEPLDPVNNPGSPRILVEFA